MADPAKQFSVAGRMGVNLRLDADVVIFGGGCAGLWLLDDLRRRGARVVLVEARHLGDGQTSNAQGILHGGLKYQLNGVFSAKARMVRDMPHVWQASLAGQAEPDLSKTRLRSNCCYLWRSNTFKSRTGMLAAQMALRVKPVRLDDSQRPEPLAHCPGPVYRLDEQVIDPVSFLTVLAERNRGLTLKVDHERVRFEVGADQCVQTIVIDDEASGRTLSLRPNTVVFAAGAGNEALRRQVGLTSEVTQRRPLHIVMLRGRLPQLNGHCIDGAQTRVTITSDVDSADRVVWQLGGQITEVGVGLEPDELIARAQDELSATLPDWRREPAEWGTLRVDRAERRTSDGSIPTDVELIHDGNIITAWPTKLVLAPLLTQRVNQLLATQPQAGAPAFYQALADLDWPQAPVAQAPWERITTWKSDA